MQFYTYDYLLQQTHTVNKIQWAIMAGLFLILLVMGFFWVRKRLDYKFKEIGILIIVLLLLLGGIQLNTYYNAEASDNQYAQMIGTLQAVAKSMDVEPNKLKMNRTDLNIDPVVEVEGKFYLIRMSDDKASYLIQEIEVKNQKEFQTVDTGGKN
ncbi:DUF3290 family protein [Enterococcus ureasiticus]|uniref:DUF3290 domain-containing protein n=1 Tax=Enterococcus ureasiticus TaxID=903984 RepID=A0A1E5GNB7_9ENTE|nr:DUF3290 family protein [Enterococcus ureasiticus]OEG14161.1 hypothetical protein BCR21_04015 [Enterococcus ureasiticus]